MSFSRDFNEFMRIMRFTSFMRYFYEFSCKTWVIEIIMSYELHEIFLEFWAKLELCDLWVVRWAIPMRRMSWVMSHEYFIELWATIAWVESLCIDLSLSVGCVDLAPRVSLDEIRKDSYWCSLTMYAKHRDRLRLR